jgi:hypothetical protein
MKLIILVPMLALLAAGCSPKATPANVAQANTAQAAAPQMAAANGTADCAAASLDPGSQACRDYQSAMASAGGADASDLSANATQMRSQMQAQMDQQRAQMQQQMRQDTQNAQKPGSGCTTTRDANNNVSTSCP